eukprot:13297542-Alexandrium_andersonii.AAC.1
MPGRPTRKPGRHPTRGWRPTPARSPRSHAPGPPGARSRACPPAARRGRCSPGESPRTARGAPPSIGHQPPGA